MARCAERRCAQLAPGGQLQVSEVTGERADRRCVARWRARLRSLWTTDAERPAAGNRAGPRSALPPGFQLQDRVPGDVPRTRDSALPASFRLSLCPREPPRVSANLRQNVGFDHKQWLSWINGEPGISGIGRRPAGDLAGRGPRSSRHRSGGEGWIRTSVRLRGQIYSLLPLTTRPPLHEDIRSPGQAGQMAVRPGTVNGGVRRARLFGAPAVRQSPGPARLVVALAPALQHTPVPRTG